MKKLREYQEKIVNDVLESDNDLIICLPTGSGKTVIASAIIEKLQGKVIFIVPRLELIKQANNEFGEVDIVWSDKTKLNGNHCIIASKDSLRIKYDKFPDDLKEEIKNGTVIIDEVHVSLEQSWKLIQKLQPKRVLGLTATPERMDGKALLKGSDSIHKFGLFDDLLQSETVPSLIRKGYLSQLKYYAKPIEGITEIKPDKKLSEELSDKQMMKIFNENAIWGDIISSYEQFGKERPALGFTNTIAMAETVVNLFNNAGYNFKVISGEMSVKERAELINALKNRKIDGLVNASLLTYGFDCPAVSYAFSLRHIKSRSLWFQIVGRILRTCEGKENAIFVDHGDSISEFSEPDCSLPIMDEFIKWRVNGETVEEKAKRKKGLKRVQETMREIQELDPLPAELVEITTEDTWERLVRIIRTLRQEKEKLSLVIKQNEVKNQLQAETIANLQQQNKMLEQTKKIEKVIDSDKTFDYIRRNYIQTRQRIERSRHANGLDCSPQIIHKLVIRSFLDDEAHLPFLYNKNTFTRGMDYWSKNYENKIKESY